MRGSPRAHCGGKNPRGRATWDHGGVTNTPRTRVSDRFNAITPSATLAVDAKAKALKAAGRPVIGFGAGEPDFATPDYIVEAAVKAARNPAMHRYTPAAGLPALREAIAEKTLLGPGDEAILPTPYWTTYPEVVKLAGATPVEVFAGADQDYKVTVEQLEAARTERTKVLLMCSPSNPTGSVYTPEELTAIGQWALEHGIWVISDEIYEHLLYEDARSAHIVKLVPELADQSVILNGVAKTYAMTGWRVGWMIGPSDVIKAALSFQSHLTSNVNNIAQEAARAAVSGSLDAVDEMRVAFDRRRRTIVDMLRQIDGFDVPTPKGAFYVYPSVERLLGREIRGRVANTSGELADLILDEVEVAAVPGEAFGPSGFLRFSYALADDDLVEGITRVQELFA